MYHLNYIIKNRAESVEIYIEMSKGEVWSYIYVSLMHSRVLHAWRTIPCEVYIHFSVEAMIGSAIYAVCKVCSNRTEMMGNFRDVFLIK